MKKKRIVIALGHHALGTTLPEQKTAVAKTAKAVAGCIKENCQVVITHSNGPQVGMIHMAMAEFCRIYPEYTAAPMSVCSAMSQGYIGYDLQNGIRTALLNQGICKPVSTVLTQVVVDPYDDAFYHPAKIIGRVMNAEEAGLEERKGNHVTKVPGGYRRIVAAPKPIDIIEIESIRALLDADQTVIACGGGGIPVLSGYRKRPCSRNAGRYGGRRYTGYPDRRGKSQPAVRDTAGKAAGQHEHSRGTQVSGSRGI